MISQMRRLGMGCVLAGLVALAGCVDRARAGDHNKATDVMQENTMTLEGLAENAKAGAYLATDSGGYYVQGLQAWPDSVLGRRVAVTGVLTTVEHRAEDLYNERGEINQGMVGTQRILRAATWRLADGQ